MNINKLHLETKIEVLTLNLKLFKDVTNEKEQNKLNKKKYENEA